MKSLVKRNIVLVILLVIAINFLIKFLPRPTSEIATVLLLEGLMLCAMLLLNHMIVKQPVPIKPTTSLWQQKGLFLPPLLFLLLIVVNLFHEKGDLVYAGVIALSVAIVEEYTFRGLIFGQLVPVLQKKWSSLLVAGLIFGNIHWLNLAHQTFFPTLLQVIQVSGFGMLCCAFYLRSGTLLLPILLHFLLDFMGLYSSHSTSTTTVNLPATLVITLIYVATALWFVRAKKANDFNLRNK
jgi:membrane protease YdiL (CAAX protease family)